MSFSLRIEHANGQTNTLDIVGSDDLGDDTLPSLTAIRKERSILREPDQTDQATVTVYRGAWNEVRNDLDNIDDKFFIAENNTDIFGGRLNDWEFEGPLVSVKLHDAKADALGATPSGGADVYQPQADDTLLKNELLSRVGTVGEGAITQQNGSIAFEESHSSPGKSITKLAETTGSETVYQPDFTLDYVDSLGSDRTGTTLSPSNQNVLGSPRIQRREKEDFTHIRVLGSQNGSTQVSAERTIDSNTTREKWGLYIEKDAQRQSRVDDLADEIQSELQSGDRHIEVELGVPASVALSLGDEFTVTLPEHDIDTTLRALRVTRIVDTSGDRYSCLFSNRRLARELQGERRARSADSFDSGNPGQYYALADGEGWDAVDSGESYEFSFYRPTNTIAEYRAVLQLESREYRLRAAQSGHDHSVSIPDHNHDVTIPDHNHSVTIPDHDHSVPINITSDDNADLTNVVQSTSGIQSTESIPHDQWRTVGDDPTVSNTPARITFNTDTSFVIAELQLSTGFGSGLSSFRNVFVRLHDTSNNEYIPDSNGHIVTPWDENTASATFTTARNLNGDTIQLEYQVGGSSDIDVTPSFYFVAHGPHNHIVDGSETTSDGGGTTETTTNGGSTTETTTNGGSTTETTSNVAAVDPGINTISGEQVSNVSVDIGGTTVASGLSAPIDTTIDISGQLSDGSNSVTITSDSLGELRATVEYEGLKNANQ